MKTILFILTMFFSISAFCDENLRDRRRYHETEFGAIEVESRKKQYEEMSDYEYFDREMKSVLKWGLILGVPVSIGFFTLAYKYSGGDKKKKWAFYTLSASGILLPAGLASYYLIRRQYASKEVKKVTVAPVIAPDLVGITALVRF